MSTCFFSLDFPLKTSSSTKPAPTVLKLVEGIGKHSLLPASCVLFPHPLQNRVPRVQVLLPLPQNRRKHWGFAGFLFSCVALLSGAFWFGFLVSPPVRTGCTPLQHPERTRFRLFLAFPGAFRCFCPLLTCKIFGSVFVHPAVQRSQVESIRDTM